jgi:corrinoid protein of di/trimethylamine methyltransferase
MTSHTELFEEIAAAVIAGDAAEAGRLARAALAARLDAADIIEEGCLPGIRKVGDLWEQGDYFLPELMASAEAMKTAMAVLRPALKGSEEARLSRGTVVIGTIEGDIHDIGKNLVASMLSANGFNVIDLGADVKLERFVDTALASGAGLICLSALLTTTMTNQKRLIELLKIRGVRDRFKVLVGGAPVTDAWAKSIGADGYGENALAAVRVALDAVERG